MKWAYYKSITQPQRYLIVDGKQELNLVEDDKEFIAVKKEYSKLLY